MYFHELHKKVCDEILNNPVIEKYVKLGNIYRFDKFREDSRIIVKDVYKDVDLPAIQIMPGTISHDSYDFSDSFSNTFAYQVTLLTGKKEYGAYDELVWAMTKMLTLFTTNQPFCGWTFANGAGYVVSTDGDTCNPQLLSFGENINQAGWAYTWNFNVHAIINYSLIFNET